MSLHERMSSDNAWSRQSHEPKISEGVDLERALLGCADLSRVEAEYLPFQEAIEFAKKHQPGPFGRSQGLRNLRDRIVSYCGNESVPVKFYTAVGTPLDIYHGVDGFFEQGDRIVTIDVSMREKESYKADVLLVASLDENGGIVISEDEIKEAAAKIASQLNTPPARLAA